MVRLATDGTSALRPRLTASRPPTEPVEPEGGPGAPDPVPTPESAETAPGPKTGSARRSRKRKQNAEEAK